MCGGENEREGRAGVVARDVSHLAFTTGAIAVVRIGDVYVWVTNLLKVHIAQ